MARLSIIQHEEKIIETLEQNSVVAIIGESGFGKSTQLSQMLHRRGYTKSGIIGATQSRRVAAVSVARYLTDGFLLRESLANPELNQYPVIILDEAHERSLNISFDAAMAEKFTPQGFFNAVSVILEESNFWLWRWHMLTTVAGYNLEDYLSRTLTLEGLMNSNTATHTKTEWGKKTKERNEKGGMSA